MEDHKDMVDFVLSCRPKLSVPSGHFTRDSQPNHSRLEMSHPGSEPLLTSHPFFPVSNCGDRFGFGLEAPQHSSKDSQIFHNIGTHVERLTEVLSSTTSMRLSPLSHLLIKVCVSPIFCASCV